MLPRFTLRKMFVVVTLGVMVFWFLWPMRNLQRGIIDRIQPGMTVWEAIDVVGLPLGSYDGICRWDSNAPARGKGTMPSWIGINGEIVLILDGNDRVVRAEFHRPRIQEWQPSELLWERVFWLQGTHAPLARRIVWYLGLAALGTFAFAELLLPPKCPNPEAWLGLVGLVLGPALSIAVFGDSGFNPAFVIYGNAQSDPSLPLLAPLASAIIGIIIGWMRRESTSKRSDAFASEQCSGSAPEVLPQQPLPQPLEQYLR